MYRSHTWPYARAILGGKIAVFLYSVVGLCQLLLRVELEDEFESLLCVHEAHSNHSQLHDAMPTRVFRSVPWHTEQCHGFDDVTF